MEIRIYRRLPDSFRRGLTVEQAWSLHAKYLTSATTPAAYNAAAAKALLCLSPSCLSGQKRLIATTFLQKHGKDALAPLWAVPGFDQQSFTSKEVEFFFIHWPQQFALTPQGTRMPLAALKRVAPECVLLSTSRSKRQQKDLADLFKLDCRAKRHAHHMPDFLPEPDLTSAGAVFYNFENHRARAIAGRAAFVALLAWLGRERAALLFVGTAPTTGSYAPAARTLLALLGDGSKWGTKARKAKRPRGYVPYAGCDCEAHLSA